MHCQNFVDEHFYLHWSKKKKRISTYFDAHLPVSLLITYSALSVSQHIYFACDFQQTFIDEHFYLHRSKKKKRISTYFDVDFPITDYIQCTISLSTYLFCMWISTNFHWWTFLSSSILKEEKNFYLFWCSFTWKSTDYIQCTVSLSTYLFCMWLSIKFCWWTFVSSSIQKEENNFYLFRCWFPCKSTGYVQSLNIFILHVTFNKLSLMNIFIFIDPKRRK